MKVLTLSLLALASPALAQEVPFPDYFAGRYDLVARLPGTPPEARLDQVVISATDGAFPLILQACSLGAGELTPEAPMHEGGFPLTGNLGSLNLTCDIMNNGDNYPILNCYADRDGTYGMMTFWPTLDETDGATCP